MHHYRKTKKKYATYNAGDAAASGCTFCKEAGGVKAIYENNTMFVIPNRVAYDMFEGRKVIDHVMVIPKHHRESIADFTDQERLDQMAIAGDYESRGYNVYARGKGSVSRSVNHQHTHLIKLSNNKPRFIFFAEKPHLLIDH
jgi:diadenosine tetraphosphate (Ap4A) HIT family hydrolase